MARGPRWVQQIGVRIRRTSRTTRIVAAVAALLVVAALVAIPATRSSPRAVATSSRFLTVTDGPRDNQHVRLDTSLFVPSGVDSAHPAPAVMIAHGFGGTKESVAGQARTLAQHGYVVLTWTSRGFGRSGGDIALDSPDYEVKDARGLVSWLGRQSEVQRQGPDDPRVGIVGGSYGGALAIMTAAYDHRVDAIVPIITWNDLARSLFPQSVASDDGTPTAQSASDDQGVFKRDWAGLFFAEGLGQTGADPTSATCGRFTAQICRTYQQIAETGTPTAQAVALLRESSPALVLGRVRAPTLLIQGETDTLFPLSEADANARGIAATGTPVQVAWYAGGHDGSSDLAENGRQQALTLTWLGHWLRGTGPRPTAFTWSQVLPVTSSDSSAPRTRTFSAPSYPGLRRGTTTGRHPQPLQPGNAIAVNPPGGSPAALSTIPGLSSLTSLASGLAGDIPGQNAQLTSPPLTTGVDVIGSPQVTAQVTSSTSQAVLFGKVYDVDAAGNATLPQGLVSPLRLTGLTPGDAVTVRIALPAIVHNFAAGHRIRVVLSTTDRAYASPDPAAIYQIAVPADSVSLPGVTGHAVDRTTGAAPYFLAALGVLLLALVVGALGLLRRRVSRATADGDLATVPLVVEGLRKAYGDGFVAVDGVSFRVEQGQVIGLLGPNGAGKTTALRTLMGLIRPTAGSIRVFGELVEPGAPVLGRVGAFVEGPGLLPHLPGLANLRLYWAATGRPPEQARLGEALEIAGLGDAIHRPVRTYSQGMRQRLAIAQALLGMPDLLVLDEPTNGLDPPQIREMREVITSYVETGRTVVVSSHVLAEVEQTCSHVVVMNYGKLIAAGTVDDIIGSGGALSVIVDDVPAALHALTGAAGVVTVEPDGPHDLVVTVDGMSGADVVVLLVAADVRVERIGPRRGLEDAFLALVGEA